MKGREQHDELIARLLAGEDPAGLASDDPAELEELARSLELLSLAAEPMSPGSELRSAIVDAAADTPGLEGFVRRTAEFFQIDESKARAVLASIADVDADPWFDDAVPGVRLRQVDAGASIADATCLLVYMQPGVAYPTHRHLGDEWCLFLQGRGLEGGRERNPGDLVLNPGGSEHLNLASAADSAFVFGVVLHEGLEFTNPV